MGKYNYKSKLIGNSNEDIKSDLGSAFTKKKMMSHASNTS